MILNFHKYYILHCINELKQKNIPPSEYFQISNNDLSKQTQLECTSAHSNDNSWFINFNYNRTIKKYPQKLMVTMAMVAILKCSNPKCTAAHHKDHSCDVLLQLDQINIFPDENKFPICICSKSPTTLIHTQRSTRATAFHPFMHNQIHISIIKLNTYINVFMVENYCTTLTSCVTERNDNNIQL